MGGSQASPAREKSPPLRIASRAQIRARFRARDRARDGESHRSRSSRRNISQSGAAPADLAKLGRIEADQTHEASHKAKQPWQTWQKPWQQPWQQARKYSGSAAQRMPRRQHRRTTAGSRHQETRTSEQKSASTHLKTKNMEPLQMHTHMYIYKKQRRNKAVKAAQSR